MNQASDKSPTPAAWTGILPVLGLLVIACACVRTISNPEVWMHLASGQWIAANGIPRADVFSYTREGPWIDPSWLYDRILYGLWQVGGAPTVILAHLVVVLAAFALMLPAAREWGGHIAIGLALILSAWLLAPRMGVRPEVFCLLFSAFFLFMLTKDRKPALLWCALLPAQVLWANMHNSFLLGPGIALLFTLQAVSTAKGAGGTPPPAEHARKRVASLGLLTAGVLLATLINPYGPALHRQVFATWGDPAQAYVKSWISPFSDQFLAVSPKHMITLALLVGAGGLVTQRRRLPIALTTLAVLSAFLVVRSVLLTALFALFAFPFLCLSFSALGESVSARGRDLLKANTAKLSLLAAVATVLVAALSCGAFMTNSYYTTIGSASSFGLGVEYDLFPSEALRAIEGKEFPDRALNMVGDGGFLAWRVPERKIFVDQRASLYGSAFYQDLFNGLLRGEPEALGSIMNQWDPEAVIINACARNASVALRNLMMEGRWALVYFDGTTAILVRPVSQYADLLTDSGVQAAGLEILDKEYKEYRARLGGLIRPAVPPRLIGAGTIFLALGRYEEAAAMYATLAAGAPSMASAVLSLGICQVQLDKTDEAIETLAKACDMLPRNALSWLWLSRAYAQANAESEARQAYERGQRINPATAAAFGDPTAETP